MTNRRRDSIKSAVGGIRLDDLTVDTGGNQHPLGKDFGFELPDDRYLMDPGKIELQGRYVRSNPEREPGFEDFVESVRQRGEIEQAIGIRAAGSPLERRYILVYGMRRWKASLAAGLNKIPVRDYGAISEADSLRLQMLENEARESPHAVDTAYGYFLLVKEGRSQSEIARETGRKQPYVSYMSKVGEAVALLRDEERAGLYASDQVTVRAFQKIAQMEELSARKRALLDLARRESASSRTPGRGQSPPFEARQLPRGRGRSFRVRWRDEDLRDDPEGFTTGLHAHVVNEYERLVARLREIEDRVDKDTQRSAIRSAAERLETTLEQMRSTLSKR